MTYYTIWSYNINITVFSTNVTYSITYLQHSFLVLVLDVKFVHILFLDVIIL